MIKGIKRSPVKKSIKRVPLKKGVVRTPVSGPLILSRKDPRDDVEGYNAALDIAAKEVGKSLIDKISTEAGYIENLTETNLEKTVLYPYQRKFCNDKSRYRHVDKSRQVGMSYCFSCEGFAKSQLLDIYTGLFISYNQEEANEKITYARSLYESVPHKYRKKMIVDRVTALEWESRTGDGKKAKTRLISHPQREPRGKGFNTDVYLDEDAHYTWPDKVYVAAVPIITRGFGQLSLASSPLGKSGLHYRIGHDKEVYKEYSRHKIYWWNNPDFLKDEALKYSLRELDKLAKTMETPDRVEEFGNVALQSAYNNMLEDYFQQEYELKALDESSSYYPIELIKQCTFDALRGWQHIEDEDLYGEHPIMVNPIYPNFNFFTYDSIESLSHAIAKGSVGKRFFAGFDVGRKEDASEIIVLEEVPSMNYLQVMRLSLTLKRMEFRKQFEVVEKLFKYVPIMKMRVDSTGMGKNIAEDLGAAFHSRIEDVNFTNENKGEMASNLKLRMEDQTISYPNDRDLVRQIHSIKRKTTETSVVKFEVDQSERKAHHGDKFWALAMASSAGRPAQMHRVTLISANMAQKIEKTDRLIQIPVERTFIKSNFIHGINYKQLPRPARHFEMFNIGGMHNV